MVKKTRGRYNVVREVRNERVLEKYSADGMSKQIVHWCNDDDDDDDIDTFSWSSYWESLISATVEDAAPTDIVLTFPSAKSLVASDFTIAGFTINSASWSGDILTLVLSNPVLIIDSDLTLIFNKTRQSTTVTNNVTDDGDTIAWYDLSTVIQESNVVSSWESKITYTTGVEILLNGGNLTKWVDTNTDGLADDFILNGSPTPEITDVGGVACQKITSSGVSGYEGIYAGGFTVGKTYNVIIKVRANAATNVRFLNNNVPTAFSITSDFVEYAKTFTAAATTLFFTFLNDNAGWFEIEYWSCRAEISTDLLQGTTDKRPTLTATGVLFDSTNDVLKSEKFELAQPTMIYLLINVITWGSGNSLIDGFNDYYSSVSEGLSEYLLKIQASTISDVQSQGAIPTGSYHVITVSFNGANSYFQIDNNSKVITDTGVKSMDGITLGALASGLSEFSNIEVKELIIRSLNDEETVKDSIINALILRGIGTPTPISQKEPLFGWSFDDSTAEQYTVGFPMLEAYGNKGTFFCDTAAVGDPNLTVAQMLEIQSYGHEIGSHGISQLNVNEMSEAQMDAFYGDSKAQLEAWGMVVHNFAAPGWAAAHDAALYALNYYDNVFAGNVAPDAATDKNDLAVPYAKVRRVYFDTVTYGELVILVDSVIADDGRSFMIMIGHPQVWDAALIQKAYDISEYIVGKGYHTKTCNEIMQTVKSYVPISYYDYMTPNLEPQL